MPQSHSLLISRPADVIASRRTAKELAHALGFNATQQEELVLVVSELASNVVKHALRGTITIQTLNENGRAGILVTVTDQGPGFNVEQAMRDGHSGAGTLGCGLGAVNRLVDELEIASDTAHRRGTQVVCKKWLQHAPTLMRVACPLDIGIVTRPKVGQDINGDSFVIKHGEGSSLIAVIDGVGHGALAHKSALAARTYIESHGGQALPDLFRGVERACSATSGVVMALAHIDWTAQKLTFASIGNIEARAFGTPSKPNLLLRRGIVGRRAPAPKTCENPWPPGSGLVLHSDGLSSQWHWDDFPRLLDKPAQAIAEHMHRSLHKPHDDATVLVVK